MATSRDKSFSSIALETVGWPMMWGMLACTLFYFLIHQGIIESPTVERYFSGHPVEYVETALFFIGVAAILGKLSSVSLQLSSLQDMQLPPKPPGGQRTADAGAMLKAIEDIPKYLRNSVLGRRLEAALQYVHRKGTALGLDQELKHLSDVDVGRQQESYALVQIIIWAIPMLGFLGTVIGITLAIADLSPQALVASPDTAMDGLLAGLAVAFDTTALALVLSILLMFSQFLTSRVESVLLEGVDEQVARQLVGRFEELGTQTDPTLAAMRHVTEELTGSMEQLVRQQASWWNESVSASHSEIAASWEQLVERQASLWNDAVSTHQGNIQQTLQQMLSDQAALWNESVAAAQHQWAHQMKSAGTDLRLQVDQALTGSLQDYVGQLVHQESASGERVERHWQQLQHAITENARIMQAQQSELARQGDALLQSVQQIREVAKLQRALEENLSSLSTVHRLDDALEQLTTAIGLLNTRLGVASESARRMHVVTRGGGRQAA